MRIHELTIRNYRNIRYAHASDLPDFILIGGGNGCGKSALLEAIFMAKEAAASYTQQFRVDRNLIASDADHASVKMVLQFSADDRKFASSYLSVDCPAEADVNVTFVRRDTLPIARCPTAVRTLLMSFAVGAERAPGFFDYFNAHRRIQEQKLNSISLSISADQAKQSLSDRDAKHNYNKQYLAAVKIRDLQRFQHLTQRGEPTSGGSLDEIRYFFDQFFTPMQFIDVEIDHDPVRFTVRTPTGDVDIDDLSSGEKEIFNTYLHFHQLRPRGAIVLFDEPDIHLHPDFARRYIGFLRSLGAGNQFWITTHSPEMMMGVDDEEIYTVAKVPSLEGSSQFFPLIADAGRYNLLKDIMGGAGIAGVNHKIVFVEGERASADVAIYEKCYPPTSYNIRFVPSQSKDTVTKIAARVNELLTSAIGFSEYFCIVDSDSGVEGTDVAEFERLVQLNVYHVENYLLDEVEIFELSNAILRDRSPYRTVEEVSDALKALLMSEAHVNELTAGHLNMRLRRLGKEAMDAVFRRRPPPAGEVRFEDIKPDVLERMARAVADGTWKERCKGGALLRAYCGELGLNYHQFRNLLIDRMETVPEGLADVIARIGPEPRAIAYQIENGQRREAREQKKPSVLARGDQDWVWLHIPEQQEDKYNVRYGEVELNDYKIVIEPMGARVEGPDHKEQERIGNAFSAIMRRYDWIERWNRLVAAGEDPVEIRRERLEEMVEVLGVPRREEPQ